MATQQAESNNANVVPLRRCIIDKIIAFEDGRLNEQAAIALFQELLDSGMLLSLQGTYQRTARRFLNAGLIVSRGLRA